MKYLKCKYKTHGGHIALFSHECLLVLDGLHTNYRPNWLIVKKEDVIPITEDTGLVRLLNTVKTKRGCAVDIMNVGEHSISRLYAPQESIFIL